MTTATAIATVLTYDNVTMLATSRCDRCGGQAYVEVSLKDSDATLLFCSHHATKSWDKLVTLRATISDHRPYLLAQAGQSQSAQTASK